MKKLVVGATGAVGSAVVAEHSRLGISALAASRDPSRRTFPPGDPPAAFDDAEPAGARAALDGVDAMFVLAPPGTERQVDRWEALFGLAREAGVRHGVLMTTKDAGEDTPRGQGEAALRASGLGWTLLRPTFLAQNLATCSGDSFRRESAFHDPAGEGRAAFVDARDLAAVAAEVLARPEPHPGAAHELTGPEALSMAEVARVISQVTGREVRSVDPGPEGDRQPPEANGLPASLAGLFAHLCAVAVKNGRAAGTAWDVERVLGRLPTSFASFARDHASVWAPAAGRP